MPQPQPLHFVTLLGSLRKASHNGAIARTLPELVPGGVTVSHLGSVADIPHYDADIQARGFPREVMEMADAIRSADGVVIVTPEYNYSVPGALKNALDWLSRLAPQPFAGKPVAIQTASPGLFGGARAQYPLRQVMGALDAILLNKPEVMVAQVAGKVTGEPGTLTEPAARDFIALQLTSFAELARRVRQAAQ